MIRITQNSDSFMIRNDFVDKFLCEANGSFVKVYIYLLRHANNPELTLGNVANSLNLLESDVIRAIKYWDKAGIIKYDKISDDDFDIMFIDEESLAVADNTEPVSKSSTPKPSTSSPTLVTYTKREINSYMKNNDGIRHMFLISEQLLNRALTETDRKILFGLYDYLELPVEVIFTLLEHCISNGKSNMRYIEKVAYSWADKGINTLAKASGAVKEENEINSLFKKFKTMFKITGRELTATEETYIKSWVFELKRSDEQIAAAYEKTVSNTGKIVFKYIDTILRNPDETTGNSQSVKGAVSGSKRNFFQDYDSEISDFDVEVIKNLVNNK